jgi:hypothetical protein
LGRQDYRDPEWPHRGIRETGWVSISLSLRGVAPNVPDTCATCGSPRIKHRDVQHEAGRGAACRVYQTVAKHTSTGRLVDAGRSHR